MHLGRKTGVVLVLVLAFFVAASTASRRVYSAQFDSLHQQPMFNVRDFGAKVRKIRAVSPPGKLYRSFGEMYASQCTCVANFAVKIF